MTDELEKLRHSLSHLLASAVLEIYPDAKPTLGPATKDGFYYDFDFPTPVSHEDLAGIEKLMKKKMAGWKSFEKKEISKEKALDIYQDNQYKTELIEEIHSRGEKITLYTSGDFTDLCRGGHIDDLSKTDPDSFKLIKVAGAYWRGDEKNKMLTRIYGLAFESKEKLEQYLELMKEAEKRDHRKIGKELDLFTFSDLIGSGLPLFTPKGTAMRNAIVDKIQSIQKGFGYKPVNIPHITKINLYQTSGHAEKFGDELFKVKGVGGEFVMKPMNCPHHTQIYASSPKSYKDLPVRYSETTTVYRDEQTGELLGLSRVRSITQDDGHIFCRIDQIEEEVGNIVKIISEFYKSLGMYNKGGFRVSLSVRDQKSDKYLGSEKVWQEAESILENIAKKENLPYERVEGEAAFYGPKLDFMFKDAIGREWQLATVQLDFVMPERFKLEYTDKDGSKKNPVMIHRAIAGSLERFMSVIIEHFAGAFPFWLSPVQIKILPIGENQLEYAKKIKNELEEKDFRTEWGFGKDSIGKRIRSAKQQKIPYIIVIGDKEIETNTLTIEERDTEQTLKLTIEEFKEKISN